jgi:hypothetical protein
MLAFEDMLREPAKVAGIKVPENCEDFSGEEFPHFKVYCIAQLGRPMPYPTVHWRNAEVIAKIPDADIRTTTFDKLVELGFE